MFKRKATWYDQAEDKPLPSWAVDRPNRPRAVRLALLLGWVLYQAISWALLIVLVDMLYRQVPLTIAGFKWWLSLWL